MTADDEVGNILAQSYSYTINTSPYVPEDIQNLKILIGSRPFKSDKESELVKLNILNILFEKYGIKEEDQNKENIHFYDGLGETTTGDIKGMYSEYYPEIQTDKLKDIFNL